MENMNVIEIHFTQNLTHITSVMCDINAILLGLENSDTINVLLDKKQTIKDIDLLLSQLTKYLARNRGKRYNYTFHEITWGECMEMQKQVVVEVTYYLYEIYE